MSLQRLVSSLPSADVLSGLLVIGRQPNSSYDYYIEPRLSEPARRKLHCFDPHRDKIDVLPRDPSGFMVIINRYVTGAVMRWLENNRAQFSAIVWLLDDDLRAMVQDPDIPLKIKARPIQTLRFEKRLQRLVDCLIVSTRRLAAIYRKWPTCVAPPLALLPEREERPLNPASFCYFAKMHGPEHRFLFPVMQEILARHGHARLTIIANGRYARQWQALERVSVLPEMAYGDYLRFLDTQGEGGVFLVPLIKNKLNASRSDAKLLDVGRAGCAALISDHRAYRKIARQVPAAMVKEGVQHWVEAIDRLIRRPEKVQENRRALSALLAERAHTRAFIV